MSAAKKLGEARLGMLAPGQRVPALAQRNRPLFSINPNSSLPEQPSTIGRFIETAGVPGSARFSSARLPKGRRSERIGLGRAVRALLVKSERMLGKLCYPTKTAEGTRRRRRPAYIFEP